jgi:hypothetical protein
VICASSGWPIALPTLIRSGSRVPNNAQDDDHDISLAAGARVPEVKSCEGGELRSGSEHRSRLDEETTRDGHDTVVGGQHHGRPAD